MHFQRRLTPSAKVDLVPMIDVVFQLVVFFMVSSTFVVTPGIPIVLPESKTAEPVVMTQLVITIQSEDIIYLNTDKIKLDQLDKALVELRSSLDKEISSIIIEGDKGVSYDVLVKVLDVVRKHGFRGVNLKMKETD